MEDKGVFTLQLAPSKDLEYKLFKLKIGQTLSFTLAPELVSEEVILFCDYPPHGKQYRRETYTELTWQYTGSQVHLDPDRHVELKINRAGTFEFYFTRKGSSSKSSSLGKGFFVVEPQLHRPLDSITCQTYITKLLGPLSEWKDRLSVAKETGYNMIHLTPVQELGGSNSAYSIREQLRLDPRYLNLPGSSKTVTVSYTDATGAKHSLDVSASFVELKKVIDDLNKRGITVITDVVWNHTSNDSPWLKDHPDSGYNLTNSPHLRPAYALDVAIMQFSQEVADGKWGNAGISPFVSCENDVKIVQTRLLDTVFPKAKLWEYFCVDVKAIVDKFRHSVYKKQGPTQEALEQGKSLQIIQDVQYRRFGSYVDANLTMQLYNVEHPCAVCFEERIERCCLELASTLENLNAEVKRKVEGQLQRAAESLAGHVRYHFCDDRGPKWGKVTKEHPLFPRYFTVVDGGSDLVWSEIESPKGQFVLAHNGWVMNADPLNNFAGPKSQVYFQRELNVWGDSVKLRYGEEPGDNLWLWEHMVRYTRITAWLFQGFRLDNCHNTPIMVAEKLLDVARSVNSDLYVMAELFTGSEGMDNYFVNRLGIHSLVRESMLAPIPFELGRLVYLYGGSPVASFLSPPTLRPSTAHAIFYDVTHDNEPGHILTRSVYDALPNAALVNIASCASATTRGYDELVPHKIDVVSENRLYAKWSEISLEVGILKAKLALNKLHEQLAEEGYCEIFVDQVTENVVAVTRHRPATHESVIIIAFTAFHTPPEGQYPKEGNLKTGVSNTPNLTVSGTVDKIIFEARMVEKTSQTQFQKGTKSPINFLTNHKLYLKENIPVSQSEMCCFDKKDGNVQEIKLFEFCPGSVIAFKVTPYAEALDATTKIRSFLGLSCPLKMTISAQQEGRTLREKLEKYTVPKLTLTDMNYALYQCDAEEKDDGKGGGVYHIPGYGDLVYCGIQGIYSVLEGIRNQNDLGHPVCDNLRAGDWMAEYTANRLKLRQGTKELGVLLSDVFSLLSALPRYLVPTYFESIITRVHKLLLGESYKKMGKFVSEGSSLVKLLAMGSVQFMGVRKSAPLPPYSPTAPKQVASMSAGLPHFSTGSMRCWGRDTFIAIKGLLLTTKRFEEARNTILSFGSSIRHGLVPNLLGGGLGARFNCRDAAWWWMQSIQDYTLMVPNGVDILQAPVRKIFADDDDRGNVKDGITVPLSELIQEVLQRHADGISFRERGAGPDLDYDMSPPGFNVTAGIDRKTGFPFGGSPNNCGTWMDKMGGSSWAGNKGVPATPRDGSAVEIVGLCKSAVRWLSQLASRGIYPYNGVTVRLGEDRRQPLSFVEWNRLLQKSFEEKFWVPEDPTEGNLKEGDEAGYIHRRGIYKDCFKASQRFTDFQLRPNFPIAIVVAPELFDLEHAWKALQNAEDILLGPLGIATLDPKDWAYNGFYKNALDSGDFKTAKGFNYHQGPEWLWVAAYLIRAKLTVAESYKKGQYLKETVTTVYKIMSNHLKLLVSSPWRSLPELTNQNGAECQDGCPAQAWSMACFLDVLYDVSKVALKN